jgi:CheY-like chemotaxis protein
VITSEHLDRIDAPQNGTVFIVDDDEVTRQMLSSIARSAGFDTDAYASAEEFLEHFDDQKVGRLILDIGLPGIDGMELQQRLNAQGTAPPIIFVTGHGEIPLATQALRSGALFVCDDVASDSRTRHDAPAYARAGIQASLAIPLVRSGPPTRIPSVQNKVPHHEPYYKGYLARDLADLTREAGFAVDAVEVHLVSKVVVARAA